jgi:hypothetical protein
MNEEQTTEVVEDEQLNHLDLSDEEFEKQSLPSTEQPIIEAKEEVEEEESSDEEEDTSNINVEGSTIASSESTEETNTEVAVNYEEAYKEVLKPLRANGKDLVLETVEDLRNLASMGANYAKKMAAIKPSLRIIKMLENNGIDESKLNFLIDLDKKNPDAINKLLKDSNIDPLDINLEETKYSPNAYNVSDKEVELDSVLEDIKETPTFSETISIISNKWDEASKRVLLENPTIIKIINDHVGTGIYSQISEIVERERTMGRLVGVSDIDAYKQVGDYLQANNKFVVREQQTNAINTPVVNPVSNKAVTDEQTKNRRKAASPVKGTVANQSTLDFNPLALSDEEFEKIASSRYM